MVHISAGIIASLTLLSLSLANEDSTPAEAAKKQAETYAAAFLKGDYAKCVDATHPTLVEMAGGRDKMIAFLTANIQGGKLKGVTIHSVKIDLPTEFVTVDSELFTVLPKVQEMSAPATGKFEHKSFLIGVSTNSGKSWSFIEGTSNDRASIKKVLPNFPQELELPHVDEIDVMRLAKERASRVQMSMLTTVLEIYRLDLGDFPTTAEGLEVLRKAPPETGNSTKWRGPYLRRPLPNDPWGQPFHYEYSKSEGHPKVWSLGPDGVDGTADDIHADWGS